MPTKNRRVYLLGVETHVDAALLKVAKVRKRTLVRSTALTHDEVWRASRGAVSAVKRRPS